MTSSALDSLCSSLADQEENATFADLVLIGDGAKDGGVPAHGVVMAAISTTIRMALAEANTGEEERVTKVLVPDVEEQELERCLRDMYQVFRKVGFIH